MRAKQKYVRILLFVINRGGWNWHKHQDPLSVSDMLFDSKNMGYTINKLTDERGKVE